MGGRAGVSPIGWELAAGSIPITERFDSDARIGYDAAPITKETPQTVMRAG